MCYKPIIAQSQPVGRPIPSKEGDLLLPCGKCYECLSKRASDWALRCQHEISLHKENTFITLTYDDENIPDLDSRKTNFQKFLKRLRKKTCSKISYVVSHEFGSSTQRIHHHAILFGYDFPEQIKYKKTPKGSQLFTSKELDELWGHGFTSIGEANAQTAYYIAAYSIKGNFVDKMQEDGEIITYKDTMDCSKHPAIGLKYFAQNAKQLIDSKTTLPRYYSKKLKEICEKYDDLHYMKRNKDIINIIRGYPHGYWLDLLINHENNQEELYRDIYHRYAKAKIDLEKPNTSYFRNNDNNNEAAIRVADLKSDYNMYHRFIKEKQK